MNALELSSTLEQISLEQAQQILEETKMCLCCKRRKINKSSRRYRESPTSTTDPIITMNQDEIDSRVAKAKLMYGVAGHEPGKIDVDLIADIGKTYLKAKKKRKLKDFSKIVGYEYEERDQIHERKPIYAEVEE